MSRPNVADWQYLGVDKITRRLEWNSGRKARKGHICEDSLAYASYSSKDEMKYVTPFGYFRFTKSRRLRFKPAMSKKRTILSFDQCASCRARANEMVRQNSNSTGVNNTERKSGTDRTKKRKMRELVFFPITRGRIWYCST